MPCIYHQAELTSNNNNRFTFCQKTTTADLCALYSYQTTLFNGQNYLYRYILSLRHSETKNLAHMEHIGIIPSCLAIAYNSIEPRSISVGPQPNVTDW